MERKRRPWNQKYERKTEEKVKEKRGDREKEKWEKGEKEKKANEKEKAGENNVKINIVKKSLMERKEKPENLHFW